MAAPIVFFDIAGPDSASQKDFYANVFDWEIAADGRLRVDVTPRLEGVLRTDPKEAVLYMGVDDILATQALIEAHGGTIVAPRFEVPGVVILALFTDPAGNRMGLVEMDGEKAKVP